MIEPVSEAFTITRIPARIATIAMINSAALPKVAFRRPPMLSPTRAASFSVASPSRPARGMMATQASTKTSSGLVGPEVMHPGGHGDGEEQLLRQWRFGKHASQCLHRGLPR